MNTLPRRIPHLEMDAFYAGLPVVIESPQGELPLSATTRRSMQPAGSHSSLMSKAGSAALE